MRNTHAQALHKPILLGIDRRERALLDAVSARAVFPCSAWKAWFQPRALTSSQVRSFSTDFLG